MRCLWCGEKFAPAKSILNTPALTWDTIAYCSLECYQEDKEALEEGLRIYEASQKALAHDSIAQEEARVKASKFTLTMPIDLGSEL